MLAVIICGVLIHRMAEDEKKIFKYNGRATKLSIARHEERAERFEMLAKEGGPSTCSTTPDRGWTATWGPASDSIIGRHNPVGAYGRVVQP